MKIEHNETVLNKQSTYVIINEYKKDPDPIFVYDLVGEDGEYLATDRFVLVSEVPFNLTEEQLQQLMNGVVDDDR